jgi:Protein of unknown function (DUF1097)
MTQVIALALSIAVLGGIWAFLALGPLSGFVLVWAGFIGWGCFFHSGANNNALVKTIVGNAYGALVAWVALLIIVNVPVPGLGAVWPAIVGGVTVFFLVIVASIDLLSVGQQPEHGCRCHPNWQIAGELLRVVRNSLLGPNGVSEWVWQAGASRETLGGGQPLSLSSKSCR